MRSRLPDIEVLGLIAQIGRVLLPDHPNLIVATVVIKYLDLAVNTAVVILRPEYPTILQAALNGGVGLGLEQVRAWVCGRFHYRCVPKDGWLAWNFDRGANSWTPEGRQMRRLCPRPCPGYHIVLSESSTTKFMLVQLSIFQNQWNWKGSLTERKQWLMNFRFSRLSRMIALCAWFSLPNFG